MMIDADGVNFNPDDDDYFDRSWSNLDEFRFVSSTEQGWNTTNPQLADTDGDGLFDGEEYWGFFLERTNFTCHYLNGAYVCDDAIGEAANTYITGWSDSGSGGATDRSIDPTNIDTDQDGMPDGWKFSIVDGLGKHSLVEMIGLWIRQILPMQTKMRTMMVCRIYANTSGNKFDCWSLNRTQYTQ